MSYINSKNSKKCISVVQVMWSIDGKNSKRIRSIRGSALVHINYIIRYYIQSFTMYLLFVIIIVFTTIKH